MINDDHEHSTLSTSEKCLLTTRQILDDDATSDCVCKAARRWFPYEILTSTAVVAQNGLQVNALLIGCRNVSFLKLDGVHWTVS